MKRAEKNLEERQEKEKRCAALIRKIQAGEKKFLEELWHEMRPVCAWACRKFYREFPSAFQLEFDDLFQCGYIALCDAAAHTKPDREDGFTSFYLYYLAQAIYRENGLRKGGRDENGKRRFDPCVSSGTLRFDAPRDNDDDREIASLIADESAVRALDRVIRNIYLRQLHDSLETVLEKLPPDERTVIRRFYYNGETYNEIAARLNVTPDRIRKIEDRALIRMRKYGEEIGLEKFLDGGGVRKVGGGSGDRLSELKERYRQALD